MKKSNKPDTVSKCKERIQNLLKLIVRARDKRCILLGKYRQCSGPLSADHIITRAVPRTYGLSKNVVCLCIGHHFWWKPSNPVIYTREVESWVGTRTIKWLQKVSKEETHYWLKDWQKIENKLKKELQNYGQSK